MAAQEGFLFYSTMDELLKFHAFFETSHRTLRLLFASAWIDRFNLFGADIRATFEQIYGPNPAFLDERRRALTADLESGDADRVAAAQLWNQPGAYACSVPVIDELVDFLLTQDGVMGAELSGAGLGGCIITLVRRDCAEDLLAALKREYYNKNGLPMGAQPYFPVSGSMIFVK